ncbi:hypothetical protein BH23CHL2_BH23CHL2_27370 [soil metagenome]
MDSKLLASLEWRSVGPFKGGRSVAVAGHPTERDTYYFGACAGGVWKTTDGGQYWENISDGFFNTAAIGAIAVSKADPNVIYAGTGETAIRGNVSHGDGVYKSTDGGRTWTNVGLKDTRHIGDIEIHPDNPDLVYVAALGHTWGPNEERGVFRSKDGGATWEKVLYKSDRAGSHDISMDPNNPRIIYAAIWETQRYPHTLVSGGDDCGLWKTTDGGDTWEDITDRLGFDGVIGKIGVAVSGADGNRVYAVVEHEEGRLVRSDDGGRTWQKLSDDPDLRRRAWYYMHIYADPTDADTVWVLNMPQKKSIDGGKSFSDVPTPHGDNHDLWIDPQDPQRLINGNDGGACVSYNGGITWSSLHNQPTAQYYHVAADNLEPYWIYGSQQDNTATAIPSLSFDGAITRGDWIEPGAGESGYIAIQPVEPGLVFGGGIGSGVGDGRLLSWNPRTRQIRNVTVWPETHGMGAGAEQQKYRFQWTFPIEWSPHNPHIIYTCGNVVFRSADYGTSWEAISPDLTRNDPEKLKPSGGPITRDNTGAERYCTIFAFRESPHEEGVFWAGSDDGLVHISRDGGESWQNVTPSTDMLPEWALISIIEPSPRDPATAYVAATRYKLDDTTPYLLKTNNYGESWQLITNGILDDDFTRTIREDPERKGLLYAGTETGVYVSFDDGGSWQPLQLNLPVTPIHDLIVKDNDLVAATHGRSFWILDDLTPLHQMQDSLADKDAHLFEPRPTKRYRVYGGFGNKTTTDYVNFTFSGPGYRSWRQIEKPDGEKKQVLLDAGQNPPAGVIFHYLLKDVPGDEDEIKLTVFDGDGNEINSYSSKPEDEKATKLPAKAGANRFVWNMRGKSADPLKDEGEGDIFASFMSDALAPWVLPGNYTTRLEARGTVQEVPFEIEPDPRGTASAQDLKAQHDLKVQIRNTVTDVHNMLNDLRDIRARVEEWVERANLHGENRAISDAALQLKTKLETVENELIQVKAASPLSYDSRLKEKLASLAFMIDEGDAAPTFGSYEVYEQLRYRVDAQQDILKRIKSEDLAAFNLVVREAGVKAVVV